MEGWAIQLDRGTAGGDFTQLYPDFAAAGDVWPGTRGDNIRTPMGGKLGALQVATDGASGGTVELWDVSGLELGIDVSSLDAITAAQMTAAAAAGKAKLVWKGEIAATVGAAPPWSSFRSFMKGLAARFTGAAATGYCVLNLSVEGGFYYHTKGC